MVISISCPSAAFAEPDNKELKDTEWLRSGEIVEVLHYHSAMGGEMVSYEWNTEECLPICFWVEDEDGDCWETKLSKDGRGVFITPRCSKWTVVFCNPHRTMVQLNYEVVMLNHVRALLDEET